jgi:hypothetical protein
MSSQARMYGAAAYSPIPAARRGAKPHGQVPQPVMVQGKLVAVDQQQRPSTVAAGRSSANPQRIAEPPWPGPERTLTAALEVLKGQDYQPRCDGRRAVTLANCPFQRWPDRCPSSSVA